MKLKNFLLNILLSVACAINANAQIGIGTTTPDASAKLDVYSTNKGFLPPRVTLTASNATSPVSSPANGLMVFNTATAGTSPNNVVPGYYYWDGVGSKWVCISIADNLGNHSATKNLQLNNFYLSNDGGNEGIRIDNTGKLGINNSAPSQALDVTGSGKFSSSIINSGSRTYFGKDGSNMHWFGTTDAISEVNNLAYGFESNGSSIQAHKWKIGGSDKMLLNASGSLGLGTTSPTNTLHIENGNLFGTPAITSSPSIYVLNNNNSSTAANSTISVRTAGTGGGKPYYSLDVANGFGYSIGINNPTDQLIFNTTWNFDLSPENNALTINQSGLARVVIPSELGTLPDGTLPGGWQGGLKTWDISCSGVYYNVLLQRSDRRLKNTIVDIKEDAISNYLKLRPVNYYWNDGSDNKHLQYGLIAQEVEPLFPDMVSTADDHIQTKSVNYQALHALSLKVIQSQQMEIESLKKKQVDIETRLLQLETKLK